MAGTTQMSSVPKLSFGTGIIDLSDAPAVKLKPTGVQLLMDKFVKQAGPKKAVPIVTERENNSKVDLHGAKLETKVKTGHKLLQLKEQLMSKIKQKRKEEQNHREEVWKEEHPETNEDQTEEVDSGGESESEGEEIKSPLKNTFVDEEALLIPAEETVDKSERKLDETQDRRDSGSENGLMMGLDSQFFNAFQNPTVKLTPLNFADISLDGAAHEGFVTPLTPPPQRSDSLHLRLTLDTETLSMDDITWSQNTQPTAAAVNRHSTVKESLADLFNDGLAELSSQLPDNDDDDIMQVFSGRFTSQVPPEQHNSPDKLPFDENSSSKDDHKENASDTEEVGGEQEVVEDEVESDEESELGEEDVEDEDIEGDEDGDSSDEELKLLKEIRGGKTAAASHASTSVPVVNLTKRAKKRRNEFFDTEAQLSGSEDESDENDEGGSDLDEYEVEPGEEEELPPEEELKRQVQRIHNKRMLDDDNRRLMLIKEALLEDGDLHSERNRLPRFRWRKDGEEVAEGMVVDMEEGGETVEETLEMERLQKRRLELIQWQTDQQRDAENIVDQEILEDEEDVGSEFFKTAMKVVRQSTVNGSQSSQSGFTEIPSTFRSESTVFLQSSVELVVGAKDSLLKRDVSSLSKLAKGAGISAPSAQSLNKCVFTRISPSKKRQSSPRKKRKAAANSPTKQSVEAKKVKQTKSASIFNCF